MGSPADSRLIQRFNSSGEASTRRPSRVTGIPDFDQRWTTEVGCPKKAVICCQPLSDAGWALDFAIAD
jgi:hypothetical protein